MGNCIRELLLKQDSVVQLFPAQLALAFALNMVPPYKLETLFRWLNTLRRPLHRERKAIGMQPKSRHTQSVIFSVAELFQ